MMSSEEDTDCFGLFGDKSFKKNKRSRQRVDAGEPRNSYSSIPNFSSRPSLMSGGLYGAIFSQNQQHFGLFPSGYGPAKMLNELLGRQVNKEAATNNENIMLDSPNAANSVKLEFDSQNIIRRGSGTNSSGVLDLDENSTPPQGNDLAHHMLRNILQGKKDLLALDQELRNSATSNHNGDRHTPDNNNTILNNKNANLLNNNNNNNNNILNNNYESKSDNNLSGGDVSDCSELGVLNNQNNNNIIANNKLQSSNSSNAAGQQQNQVATSPINLLSDVTTTNNNSNQNTNNTNINSSSVCKLESSSAANVNSNNSSNHSPNSKISENASQNDASSGCGIGQELLKNSASRKDDMNSEMNDDDMMINSIPDSNPMTPSPGSVKLKEEILDGELNSEKDLNCRTPSPLNSNKNENPVDMKRARVENIVSSMRSSPALGTQQQVNGCKKRKLYHPQQHDNSAIERYAAQAASLNLGLNLQSLMLGDDDDDDEIVEPQLHQKRIEKDVLKSQLRSMQEQLAEMQQKYVQLCNRMEQSSDVPEDGDDNSDLNDDDLMRDNDVSEKPSPSIVQRTPTASPVKEIPTPKSSVSSAQNMLSQMMSKMISAKLGHLGPHPAMPPFNGAHPLLQHIQQQQQNAANEGLHNPHVQHPHPAFSNAAAMYLSQKFLIEQEARLAKEAAEQQERNQQQMQQLQQQQQQAQAQAQAQAQMVQQQKQQAEHHQMQMAQAAQKQQQQQQQQQQQEHQQLQQQLHGLSGSQHMQPGSGQSQQQPSMTPNNQLIPPMKTSPQQMQAGGPHQHMTPKSNMPSELSERLSMMRTQSNSMAPHGGTDLEGLADILKTEITASLSNLVDSIVTRFMHQRRFLGKQSEAAAAAAEQLNKDLLMASQILDRKSPRTKVTSAGGDRANNNQSAAMFQPPKPPQNPMNSVAAAALYNSISALNGQSNPNNPMNPFCMPEPRDQPNEQNEALSLVVTPKKKRHKVTDTRITPRTVSRILAQDSIGQQVNLLEQNNSNQGGNMSSSNNQSGQNQNSQNSSNNNSNNNNNNSPMNGQNMSNNNNNNSNKPFSNSSINVPSSIPAETPSPRPTYHPPPSMLPVSLPTSVAIPNPSLHESQVFSPYSPFFNPHGPHGPHGPQSSQFNHMHMSSSPPGIGSLMDPRDSPPLPHPPTMLHPALLAAAHHGGSPDYGHIRAAMDANDRNSDCNSGDINYDGMQPTISFSNLLLNNITMNDQFSLTAMHSSTLTPMHLRKAKLMFFWVRYPSSAVLKMYFPDIKFNKNNTAQLVKWFSNFREFYYIQMEKYARQAVSEGVKGVDDIHVNIDSEIYRVLNLHYNRNNHIEVPPNFRFVVEQTLREFFRAIQSGKDTEQSWKKSIYKIISRLDDPVPEYFKSPNFLEQLE